MTSQCCPRRARFSQYLMFGHLSYALSPSSATNSFSEASRPRPSAPRRPGDGGSGPRSRARAAVAGGKSGEHLVRRPVPWGTFNPAARRRVPRGGRSAAAAGGVRDGEMDSRSRSRAVAGPKPRGPAGLRPLGGEQTSWAFFGAAAFLASGLNGATTLRCPLRFAISSGVSPWLFASGLRPARQQQQHRVGVAVLTAIISGVAPSFCARSAFAPLSGNSCARSTWPFQQATASGRASARSPSRLWQQPHHVDVAVVARDDQRHSDVSVIRSPRHVSKNAPSRRGPPCTQQTGVSPSSINWSTLLLFEQPLRRLDVANLTGVQSSSAFSSRGRERKTLPPREGSP